MAKKDSREIDSIYVDTGVDINNRKLFISGPISEGNMSYAIRSIQKMCADNNNPIDIYVSSEGGEVYSGLALYDILEASKCVIRTHAMGQVSSMAFIIFLAGDERYATKRTRFMHHEASTVIDGNFSILKDQVKEVSILVDICGTIVSEKTSLPSKWWQSRITRKDYCIGYDRAKTLNIITHEY